MGGPEILRLPPAFTLQSTQHHNCPRIDRPKYLQPAAFPHSIDKRHSSHRTGQTIQHIQYRHNGETPHLSRSDASNLPPFHHPNQNHHLNLLAMPPSHLASPPRNIHPPAAQTLHIHADDPAIRRLNIHCAHNIPAAHLPFSQRHAQHAHVAAERKVAAQRRARRGW
jgi:hypothetical protein